MVNLITKFQNLRHVQRCNTMQIINKQHNVADHMYFTALISFLIAEEERKKYNLGELLLKALFHDIEEGIMSDIPYPALRLSEKLYKEAKLCGEKALTKTLQLYPVLQKRILQVWKSAKNGSYEAEIVRWADMLEFMFFCLEERCMGNTLVRDPFYIANDYVEESKIPTVKDLVAQLRGKFYNA